MKTLVQLNRMTRGTRRRICIAGGASELKSWAPARALKIPNAVFGKTKVGMLLSVKSQIV